MSESSTPSRDASAAEHGPTAELPGRTGEFVAVLHAVPGVTIAVYAATRSALLTVATLAVAALLGRGWIRRGR
ncbi:hypothetical protein ACWCV9_13875 [Streptomyces sp. NPDC001606]